MSKLSLTPDTDKNFINLIAAAPLAINVPAMAAPSIGPTTPRPTPKP